MWITFSQSYYILNFNKMICFDQISFIEFQLSDWPRSSISTACTKCSIYFRFLFNPYKFLRFNHKLEGISFIWKIIFGIFIKSLGFETHWVALRAPFCLNLVLHARSYILCIHTSLFLVIWYWSTNQFYNIFDVNHIFSKLQNLFLISNEKGNSIYFRLYQP